MGRGVTKWGAIGYPFDADGPDPPKVFTRVPGGSVQSAAVYAVQLAFGAPGGASGASRMRKGRFLMIWGSFGSLKLHS